MTWLAAVRFSPTPPALGESNNTSNPSGPFDFRLKINSQAINAGRATGLSYDFAGAPVPSLNVPDIGAFEFQFKNAAGPGWQAYR